MFLWIIAFLTIGQMYFEFKIVRALHLEEFNKRFVLGNLAFSILMSVGFGLLFPAAGMVIAAAGLLSTILSQPMYEFYDIWCEQCLPTLRRGKQTILANKQAIASSWNGFIHSIVIIVKLITIPFRIISWILQTGERTQKAIANVRNH